MKVKGRRQSKNIETSRKGPTGAYTMGAIGRTATKVASAKYFDKPIKVSSLGKKVGIESMESAARVDRATTLVKGIKKFASTKKQKIRKK